MAGMRGVVKFTKGLQGLIADVLVAVTQNGRKVNKSPFHPSVPGAQGDGNAIVPVVGLEQG